MNKRVFLMVTSLGIGLTACGDKEGPGPGLETVNPPMPPPELPDGPELPIDADGDDPSDGSLGDDDGTDGASDDIILSLSLSLSLSSVVLFVGKTERKVYVPTRQKRKGERKTKFWRAFVCWCCRRQSLFFLV